ncbi:MAG: MotE family protein [Hyphomonadaceae bacterium]
MLNDLLTRMRSRPKKPRQAASVRLIPAAMATAAALLGLKAVAMAEDVAEAVPAAEEAHETAEHTAAPEGEAAEAACPAPSFADMAGLSQAEVQVLQALGARREALDGRATELETQNELMAAAEQRLDERVAELRQLESTVNVLLGQLDEAQERRLANLVDVYQRMRAKDAAAVFDGLEDDVMVQVASRMRQANLAEVMGNMEPARARRLTQMLAELSRPPADGADLLERSREAPAPDAAAGR